MRSISSRLSLSLASFALSGLLEFFSCSCFVFCIVYQTAAMSPQIILVTRAYTMNRESSSSIQLKPAEAVSARLASRLLVKTWSLFCGSLKNMKFVQMSLSASKESESMNFSVPANSCESRLFVCGTRIEARVTLPSVKSSQARGYGLLGGRATWS